VLKITQPEAIPPTFVPLYSTDLGSMYCGFCEDALASDRWSQYRGKVQLILTSPPFPLNRKKRYGNLTGQRYLRWLKGLAPIFSDYLTEDGSIAIEIGNAWEKGRPTMSTLPIEALLAFKEAAHLYLCQEFICYNPARLPTPAQWVTVERIRVKDAFTRVWWMSRTDRPKADNRRVLTKYSESMRDLLKRGTYNSGERPSEHNIGKSSFLKDNGGSIPPDLLVPTPQLIEDELTEVLPVSNTRTNDPYQIYCRQQSIAPHPARMPEPIAEFFIRFLTDEGDLVMDPFAGSNTTGAVAERLKRKWLSVEADMDYASASEVRLHPKLLKEPPRHQPLGSAAPSRRTRDASDRKVCTRVAATRRSSSPTCSESGS